MERSSDSKRRIAQAISPAETPIAGLRRLPAGSGNEGCDSTGATTDDSAIMASAKPPVKHMPTAPTPLPPHSAWTLRARARSQSTMGLDSFVAQALNSRLMQIVFSIVQST